jgi:Flp pilus assembly protein TadD
LIQAGRFQDAIGYCERAMRVTPRDSRAYNNLGFALVQLGKGPQAIERFEQALQIDPNDPKARLNLGMAANNLAWQLATHGPAEGGDPVRAVTLAERACSLTTNSAFAYLDTLAAAYASAGRFDNAVTTAQKAIELARAAGQQQAANEIAARLELYRHGRAYRESKSPLLSP